MSKLDKNYLELDRIGLDKSEKPFSKYQMDYMDKAARESAVHLKTGNYDCHRIPGRKTNSKECAKRFYQGEFPCIECSIGQMQSKKYKKENFMEKNKSKRAKNVCLRCGQEIEIFGRGLCRKCYYQAGKNGELHKYKANSKRIDNKPKKEIKKDSKKNNLDEDISGLENCLIYQSRNNQKKYISIYRNGKIGISINLMKSITNLRPNYVIVAFDKHNLNLKIKIFETKPEKYTSFTIQSTLQKKNQNQKRNTYKISSSRVIDQFKIQWTKGKRFLAEYDMSHKMIIAYLDQETN